SFREEGTTTPKLFFDESFPQYIKETPYPSYSLVVSSLISGRGYDYAEAFL
ncbi:17187_t:CDS:2, partial [Acaulospora morrowiae]